MQKKFKEHINTHFPFLKDKNLLVAVSGGLDSIVLAHLLNSIKIATISLAHCNFKLRGKDSDLDEEFVKTFAEKNRNLIFTTSFETSKEAVKQKTSTQIVARTLRYQWFQKLLTSNNLDYILTAHHADDNLETFLINLTRGSGLEGFTGIPAINGNIIRTLLPFSRTEILNFAETHKINWREDTSNASTKYVRNKIRHKIIPVLKEINPSVLTTFANSINHLKEVEEIVHDKIADIAKASVSKENENLKIDIQKIKELANSKAYLYQLLKEYHFTQWHDVYDLLNAQSGKQVFSKSHRLLKDRKYLLLSKIENKPTTETIAIKAKQTVITQPLNLSFQEVKEIRAHDKQTIYVDKDLLKYPLFLRKKQIGDYIYPLGLQGKKKLSKYFKDKKFSLIDKENTWLLCNADNAIIWAIGHGQDRRFMVKTSTKSYLKITKL